MKLKPLAALVAVLALLSAAAYWLNRPEKPVVTDARVGRALVDPSVIEKAAGLRITDQGKTVSLDRESGGSWRDASYYGFPADFSKLTSFVGDLTSAKVERFVTANPSRMARLEFTGSRIEFVDASGHPLWSVEIGKNADPSGRFVRFSQDRAYLASLSAWLDADAKNWADAVLCPIKADDVAKVEIPFDAGGPIVCTRAKKGDPWTADRTPAGQRLKADKIDSVVGALDSLRFSDTKDAAEPEAGAAKKHLRAFTLTTFDGRTYTIAMGRRPEERKAKPPPPPEKKSEAKAAPASGAKAADGKTAAEKPAEAPKPEFETIPAGPVYFWITGPGLSPAVKALMSRRTFQMDDYAFTDLPQKPEDLFEPAPAPPPPGSKK
jgi:hypothetical protein